MEPPKRLTLGYSLKNIPIPPRSEYMKTLIDKTNNFIQRMRWRAHFYLKQGKETDQPREENYGFKTKWSAPHVEELESFEEDLAKMIENIKFRRTRNAFQDKLRHDIARVNRSPSVFVQADKTRNLYEVSQEQYNKLLADNITKHYKHADGSDYDNINEEAREVAEKLKPKLSERMEPIARRNAYVTLKDHKDNFENNLPCRLINPAKSETGIISRKTLDRINRQLREKINTRHWKNSAEVVQWFENISDKQRCTFVNFDIVEFYPSISTALLNKALAWARQHVTITDEEMNVIANARKSLLFSKGETWKKKNNQTLFDVTMGSFDGAEVCELVGMFALATLPAKYRTGNIGLYRDDGLGVFMGLSGSEAERVRKEITAHFKTLDLKITISCNLTAVNFLDLTLRLDTGKYHPFRKPNDTPMYIHRQSNHPPTVTKSLPAMISHRLTDISSDEDMFGNAAPAYNDALQASGYVEQVMYAKERKGPQQNKKRRRHERNITWYNPPYNTDVETKIGGRFLQLINHHFPPGSKLRQIFNPNTIKLSYSCMPSVATAIKRHNARVCNQPPAAKDLPAKRCNCRGGVEVCPLMGECLSKNVVYEARVTPEGTEKTMVYVGSTSTTFKERYSNHKTSLKHERKAHSTRLSKHAWELKRSGTKYNIKWRILRKTSDYSPLTKRCDLCSTEKLAIIMTDKGTRLNTRREITTQCLHRKKHSLARFAPPAQNQAAINTFPP